MSCAIPLIVSCHYYSLLIHFHYVLHHSNSLCWSDHVYDMACIWILYFSLLCTTLVIHQQHFGCPKYSSLSQILHNHITLSVFCDNMYKHTHSSWIHQVFSFSFHHQQCIRMRVFLTCEEYHKSLYFSINVFVYLVNFCFASFLDVILLYES